MGEHQKYIDELFTAELQFRLASAVRLATTLKTQPLDLPTQWTHGQHSVNYEEIALRHDQAEYAACFLQRSATFLLAVSVKDAILGVVKDPQSCSDPDVRAAFQIARLIRNAFTHGPFQPVWSIDPPCRDQVFSIPGVITLDTKGLQDIPFDWRHYGGPLALLRLCRFVRERVLKDTLGRSKAVLGPGKVILQQGNLILTKVNEIPPGATPVEIERLPDGGIPLGGGHVAYPAGKRPT
jgi:hypothetical protein